MFHQGAWPFVKSFASTRKENIERPVGRREPLSGHETRDATSREKQLLITWLLVNIHISLADVERKRNGSGRRAAAEPMKNLRRSTLYHLRIDLRLPVRETRVLC